MKTASFPFKKTLDEFDFSWAKGVDRRVITELAGLGFIHGATNVCLLGPPGVGLKDRKRQGIASHLEVAQAYEKGATIE